ncbi:MAG: M20/M25/M40 family metallo-hydrolase [Chitinophagaceae bacterium]|nr:M20/M25/M40 family metallo-hydrolase [Chitinophagaceae bacterium]
MSKLTTTFLVFIAFTFTSLAQEEKLDLDMVSKIRKEGLENSKVMDIAFRLTDVSGPRLTNSPGFARAAMWAENEMKSWGISNTNLEPWGEFGKGWELQKNYIAMTEPYYRPLIGFPKTWTKGTNGLKNVELLLIEATDSASLATYSGKLKGKMILLYRTDTLKPTFVADARRFSDEELEKMAGTAPQQTDTAQQRRARQQFQRGQPPVQFMNRVKDIANREGAIAVLSMSARGHDGTLFVAGGGAYTKDAPENFLDIMVAIEDYMSLCRLAKAGIPVKLEVEVKSAFSNKDTKGYNVIGEIKGTDPKLKDELVMLGGHLDSWQGATGATDNAAGCAVMMEAVRILKTLGVKPRRTIRIALWSGEEQGLHGSRNYVKNHFADPADMKLKPDHDKVSAYFNLDNGTGKVRGVYLQGNDKVRPIFAKWLEPFQDLGAKTLTISNTGGTDHLAFDAIGLPGFQFIQDPIEYNTRTHHTNMDSYDHLIADDLKQAATIVASFAYHAAMRDGKLPRKELPAARPPAPRGF